MSAQPGNASDFNAAKGDAARLTGGSWVRRGAVSIWEPTQAPRQRRSVAACGTPSGYNRHRRLGQVPCIACSDAARDYKRRQRGVTTIRDLAPHGTHAAFCRHWRDKTDPCQPCIEAERAYQREAKKRRRRERREAA